MPICTRCGSRNEEGARFCGNSVSAMAIPNQPRPKNIGRKLAKILGVFFLCFVLFVIFMPKASTQTFTSTATTADSAQAAVDNSTAEPAQSDTWKSFTSSAGRFSVLFPATPRPSSKRIDVGNGETTTRYDFVADNGKISYTVVYTDFAPDALGDSPQAFLQAFENYLITGSTLLSDQVIDLHGIPGRAYAYTAPDSQSDYTVHEFLAGTRFYQLSVTTPKGYTAPRADRFMSSFNIF